MRQPLEDDELQDLDDVAIALRIARAAPAVDGAAEAELCRRFAPRVRLYGLKHLKSSAAAADLVQDVLMITLQGLRAQKVREPQHLASFVLGTCRQVVADQRRKERRRERLLGRFPDAPEEATALAAIDDDVGRAPEPDVGRLKDCLERLSERERSVLLLSFYDERQAPDVGRELGLTAANVRVIRHRGLARLQDCMGPADATAGRASGARRASSAQGATS